MGWNSRKGDYIIEMDGPTATVIPSLAVVLTAVVGFVGSVHYRLGKQEKNDELLAQEIKHSREVSEAQHAETMSEIRRLIDALSTHRHETDGETIFRVPLRGTASQEE